MGGAMRDDEALSCRDIERIFGVPAKQARSVLKRRVAEGDGEPLQVHGTWLAPLRWWRAVLSAE